MSKVGNDSIKRVDGMFSVSGSAVAVGGMFKGDVPFCVVDSDFSLMDCVTGVLVKRYTRDEVIVLLLIFNSYSNCKLK